MRVPLTHFDWGTFPFLEWPWRASVSVTLAFLVLGVLYGTAVLAAIRARGLSMREAPAAPATA